MKPFNHRPAREEQDLWERSNRDFGLRAIRQEEEETPTFGNPSKRDHLYSEEKDEIRNLGFFKEQERHFSQNEEEEEWEERQSPINFVLVISLLVILSVVGWFGYRWASNFTPTEPPFISAESTPFKVKPENPGGMVIPHQDKLVYGRIAPDNQQPVEHLLPAPEQPIAPIPHGQPQTFVDENGQIFYVYPAPQEAYAQQPRGPQPQDPAMGYQEGYQNYPQQPLYPQQAPMAAAPQQAQQGVNPAQVPTQLTVVAPQGMHPITAKKAAEGPAAVPPTAQPQQQATLQQMAPSNQPQGQRQPVVAAPVIVDTMSQNGTPNQNTPTPSSTVKATNTAENSNTLDQLIEQELNITEPAASSSPTEEKTEIKTTAGSKQNVTAPYKIQVATLPTKAEAETELKRIKGIDPALFANKTISIQKIELANSKKPSFRVIISSFPTPNSAAQFSNKLKVHKVKGIVLNQPN